MNFFQVFFPFPNKGKLLISVERIFSIAVESDLRKEEVHSRLEAEGIWICFPRELRINATSLPFPAFPFPLLLTLSSKMYLLRPAICLAL